jgi:hypothetical protein
MEPILKFSAGVVEGEWFESNLYIHFVYTKHKFTLSDYKELLFTWDVIMQGLNDTGIKIVYACIPKVNTKTNKFTELFGFTPYQETESNTIYRMDL